MSRREHLKIAGTRGFDASIMQIYRSKNITIPRDQSLTELLHTSAYPDLPESHIICGDSLTNRSITIGELRNRTGRIAKGLKNVLRPSDQARWAVILPNSVEFLETVHAILWTDGVICPINHALKPAEIGHGLAVSRPDYIVVYGPIVPVVQEAIGIAEKELKTEGVNWVVPGIITAIAGLKGYKHIPDDFFAYDKLAIPHHKDTSTRLASIHLSSGTTGKPKGVELTHFNYVANCYQLFHHDPAVFNPRSKTVAFTPWVHIGATTMPLFLGPWTGMFHHAMPSYNFEKFAALVGSIQATMFSGVPSVVLNLANNDVTARYDFSRAQVINVGGAPLKAHMVNTLYAKAPWKLNQVFGMTEAAGYVAYQKLNEKLPDGFVGSFLPNVEARLVKEGTCEDAPKGGPGELWLRGPNISRGYAFNDEANSKAFPEKGWYNTGKHKMSPLS
jgi:acyl-CoA synthetase (AMP-forming)/AMP-acid ligase II